MLLGSLGKGQHMKNLKARIALVLLAIVAILGLAFESQIRKFFTHKKTFDISQVPLVDISGRSNTLDPNYRGYVIFYSDLVGCSACLRRLVNLNGLDKAYSEIGFYAIGKKMEEGQAFAELMLEYGVPGDYLVDDLMVFQNQFGLPDRPMLLFFNKENQLLASIPMDVDYQNLKRQLHNFINEL